MNLGNLGNRRPVEQAQASHAARSILGVISLSRSRAALYASERAEYTWCGSMATQP